MIVPEPKDQPDSRSEYHWHDLAIVMLISTLAGAALSLSFPLLSIALSEDGVGKAAIGWSAAGHGIGMLISAPFFARIIAQFGAIRTMCGGLIATSIVLVLLPIHVDPWTWFFARMVMGAACAAIFIVTESAVNAMVADRNRGKILGLYASFFCVGYATGPLIIAYAGASGWLPFLMGAALFLAGLAPALKAQGAERALGSTGQTFAKRGLLITLQKAPAPIIVIFTFGFVEMGLMSLFPLFATDKGLSTGDAALLISVWVAGNILLQFPIGWMSDRWSKYGTLLSVILISMALMAPLYWLAPGVIWLWPLMLIMGGSLGALYTLSLGLLGAAFRGAELTIANTVFIMALEAGVMIGPAAGGNVMVLAGGSHLLTLWLSVLGILAMYVAWKTSRQPRLGACGVT